MRRSPTCLFDLLFDLVCLINDCVNIMPFIYFFIRHISFFWFGCKKFQPLQVKCLKKEDPHCFVLRLRDVFLQVFECERGLTGLFDKRHEFPVREWLRTHVRFDGEEHSL